MKKITLVLVSICALLCYQNAFAQLEYKDVAGIFYNRCTSCHHQNQHAPSMMNYSETVAHLGSMLSKLQNNEMPPWSPDTSYSRFTHERLISATEKNNLITWINQGALSGDTSLAPAPPVYSTNYQLNGTPTLELKTGTFVSNANTNDSYVCFSIPTGLTQDRILQAYEIVPGNVPIVHHVVVNIDTLGTTVNDLSGNCFTISGQVGIGAYAPGAPATVFPGQFPLKTGIRVKAGSKIVMQIHYPAGTAGEIDSTKIRMYFYPVGSTGIRPIYDVVPLQNWSLSIPANTVSTYTAAYPTVGGLTADISMFAVFPHSHKVCTQIVNYAYQGIDTVKLIRIKNWNFEWQGFYTFKNLMKIPAGYKLFSKHVYNNTMNNPNNPNNPPQHVFAGTSTTDEMLFDGIQFLLYQPGDELIDVEAILANDPLLNKVPELATTNKFDFLLFPIPAKYYAELRLPSKSNYKICLITSFGQTILEKNCSQEKAIIDLNLIPNGFYIAEVWDLEKGLYSAKKLVVAKE